MNTQTMKANRVGRGFLRAGLVALVLLVGLDRLVAVGEIQVPLVKTLSGEYRNVKIFNRTATHLSFAHENGTAVIKLAEVDPETLATIERIRAGVESKGNEWATVAALENKPASAKERSVAALTKLFSGKVSAESVSPAITRVMLWRFLGGLALAWFFFGFCNSLICKKAGHPGGLLVWLPVFQMIPLFRAAGMSGWWFLGMMIPLLNLVGFVLWCVKITQARGKGFLTAVMLILPVTNLLAFLYLAFSNGHARAEDTFVPVRPPHALALN